MDELSYLNNDGVFLRRHAIARGYTDRDLFRSVRDGVLVRVRHGAYVTGERWGAADALERHRLRARAVLLTHQIPVVLSHQSGAVVHGMRLWGSDLSRVHLARLEAVAGRKHHDVAYHDAPHVTPVAVGDLPVLPAAYCALGAASSCSVEAGMVVLDSAYDLGLATTDDLVRAYADMNRWPGSARLQITLRLASPGAESVGESRARFLFWAQGIPRPQLQYKVWDGDRLVGVTDFAWPEHGAFGEFDGAVKYGELLRPGESPVDAVLREKHREDRIREITGWRCVRLTWADLHQPGRTGARVRRVLGQ